MEKMTGDPAPRLKKRLGLLAVTLAGVGVILGSGIYVIIGIAAGDAGNAVWLSFLIAAVPAFLTGLSYARLGKLLPKNAPEYHYVNHAFGRLPAFLAGWMILWAGIISTTAVSLGFAGYLNHLTNAPVLPAAIGLVIICSVVVFLGIGESAVLAGILTVVEVGGLIFIISIGIPRFGSVNYFEMPEGIPGLVRAAALVFFAYLGFEGMSNLAEEMKNPRRDLPRAIFLSIIISTVLYILVSISAVSVVNWTNLSSSHAPLADVAEVVLGARANLALTLIALGSTANTVLVLIVAVTRGMWSMACAGALPSVFCTLAEKRRTPWPAIIVAGLATSLFVFIKDIKAVAEYTNLTTLLAFIGVNASAARLIARGQNTGFLNNLLLNRLLPILGVVTSLLLGLNTGWGAMIFATTLAAVGIVIYLFLGVLSRRAK